MPSPTPQQESQLGATQEAKILASMPEVRSGKLYSAVVGVGQKIAHAAAVPSYRWRYHLINKPQTANAFVLPGGKVFVFSGIFKYASNANELAVVMAHEVAHALKHHGIIGAQRAQKAQMLGTLLQIGLGVAGVGRGAAGALNNLYRYGATFGYLRPHSREHEMEADSVGLMLMAKAGFDPRAALSFWEKFARASRSGPEYLSTHPIPAHRIENIKRLLPQAMAIYKRAH